MSMKDAYAFILDYKDLILELKVCADKQDFKERLANVKLKDVEVWAKDHRLPNSVSRRSKTLKKAS